MENIETRALMIDGTVVGELSFPEGWPEHLWDQAAGAYQAKAIPREDVETQRSLSNGAYGRALIARFGAKNSIAEVPVSDIIALSVQLDPVKNLLEAGALQTALSVIKSMGASNLVSQETVDFFVNDITARLVNQHVTF